MHCENHEELAERIARIEERTSLMLTALNRIEDRQQVLQKTVAKYAGGIAVVVAVGQAVLSWVK